MRNIMIAGGNGFLGKELELYFLGKGDSIKTLTRRPAKSHHIAWDGKTLGKWQKELEEIDILINLCGKSVDCRYTAANREKILNSRVDSTSVLNKAIQASQNPPKVWLNASSATIYMHAEKELMTESTGIIGDDFSMSVCKTWEETFFSADLPHTRQVAIRTSIVLGNRGGAFPKLRQITKLGLGGYQGRGDQKVSWIHIDDFCKAVDFVINRDELSGSVNITSANPVENKNFMTNVRKRFNVPFGIDQPKALLELGAIFMKTETELLLKSRNVYPERLLDAGFQFKYPTIDVALKHL